MHTAVMWIAGLKYEETLRKDSLCEDPLQQVFAGTDYKQSVTYTENYQKVSKAVKEFYTTGKIPEDLKSKVETYKKYKDAVAQIDSSKMKVSNQTLSGKLQVKDHDQRVDRPVSMWIARQMLSDQICNILTATESQFYNLNLLGYTNMKISQVVIMGSGMDSRSHRLDSLKGLHLFEMDLPGILDIKHELLKKAGAELPDVKKEDSKYPLKCQSLAYVPVDFEQSGCLKHLQDKGFKKDEPTLWIAEGLFLFFKPDLCEKLFKEIVRFTAQGSYFIVEQPTKDVQTMNQQFYAGINGWNKDIYGSLEEDVEKYYERLGWQVVDSMDLYQICHVISKHGYNQEFLHKEKSLHYTLLYKRIPGAGHGLKDI